MATPKGLHNQQQTPNPANKEVAQYVIFRLPQTRQQLGDGYSLPVHPQREISSCQRKLKQTFHPTARPAPRQRQQSSSPGLTSFVHDMFGSWTLVNHLNLSV